MPSRSLNAAIAEASLNNASVMTNNVRMMRGRAMLRVFSPNKREVPLRGMGDVSLAEIVSDRILVDVGFFCRGLLSIESGLCCRCS